MSRGTRLAAIIGCSLLSIVSLIFAFPDDPKPALLAEPRVQDLGTVRQGSTQSAEVRLTNTTETPLSVVRVISNCGCTTTADLAGRVIEPGASVLLPITWEIGSRRNETSVDTLVEYQHDGSEQISHTLIQLQAFVEPSYTVTPDMLHFDAGAADERILTFQRHEDWPEVTLTDAVCNHPAFVARVWHQAENSGEATVRVTFDPSAWSGSHLVRAKLLLFISGSVTSSHAVPITVR